MRALRDLFARYPGMLEAFEALPDFDQRDLCEQLKDVVMTRGEQATLSFAREAGLVAEEGGEG